MQNSPRTSLFGGEKETLFHTENSSFASLKFQLNCIHVVYLMVFTSSIMWFIIRSSFCLSLRATDYIHLHVFCSFTCFFFCFRKFMIPREHLTFQSGYANTPYVLEGDKTEKKMNIPKKKRIFLSFSRIKI